MQRQVKKDPLRRLSLPLGLEEGILASAVAPLLTPTPAAVKGCLLDGEEEAAQEEHGQLKAIFAAKGENIGHHQSTFFAGIVIVIKKPSL